MPNLVSTLFEVVFQTELPWVGKIPKFAKFAGNTSKSIVEHISDINQRHVIWPKIKT